LLFVLHNLYFDVPKPSTKEVQEIIPVFNPLGVAARKPAGTGVCITSAKYCYVPARKSAPTKTIPNAILFKAVI
jgi:hypothetical protein